MAGSSYQGVREEVRISSSHLPDSPEPTAEATGIIGPARLLGTVRAEMRGQGRPAQPAPTSQAC